MRIVAGLCNVSAVLLFGLGSAGAVAAPGDRTPYQSWSTLVCGAASCARNFAPVPANRWLEIESVSCLFAGKNAYTRPTSVRAEITDGSSNTIRLSEELVPERQFEGGYSYVVNHETLIIAYAGQKPWIRSGLYGQMSRAHCKISGNLYATN